MMDFASNKTRTSAGKVKLSLSFARCVYVHAAHLSPCVLLGWQSKEQSRLSSMVDAPRLRRPELFLFSAHHDFAAVGCATDLICLGPGAFRDGQIYESGAQLSVRPPKASPVTFQFMCFACKNSLSFAYFGTRAGVVIQGGQFSMDCDVLLLMNCQSFSLIIYEGIDQISSCYTI